MVSMNGRGNQDESANIRGKAISGSDLAVRTLDATFEIDAKERNYQTQYANIYFLRLAALKPSLRTLADKKWSTHAAETARVLDVVQGGLTWIVGTIYMDMPLKPQVLHDLVADINLASAVPTSLWRDPRRDTIQLEDESGRLTLVGTKLQDQTLCTGIVLAVLGTETASGEFDVIDFLYPVNVESDVELPGPDAVIPQIPSQASSNGTDENLRLSSSLAGSVDEYVAIVSGLEFSGNNQSTVLLDILAEYLTGELMGDQLYNEVSSIKSLIILGNATCSNTGQEEDAMTRKLAKNKKYGYDSAAYNARPVEHLDNFLQDICPSIDVVLIPGEQDPTNITLPQKAINKIMLRSSSRFTSSTLHLATNPTYLRMANRTIFGTAGQTIDDLKHYISTQPLETELQSEDENSPRQSSAIDLAQETLRWAHLAPTAPDTLWTYPFADRDPFIIESIPDIYLVGNQEFFEERLVRTVMRDQTTSCRIVLVPKFSAQHEVVLVNLRDLRCKVIKLSIFA